MESSSRELAPTNDERCETRDRHMRHLFSLRFSICQCNMALHGGTSESFLTVRGATKETTSLPITNIEMPRGARVRHQNSNRCLPSEVAVVNSRRRKSFSRIHSQPLILVVAITIHP